MKKFWPGPLTLILHAPNFQIVTGEKRRGRFSNFEASIGNELVSRFGDLITTRVPTDQGNPPLHRVEEIKNNFPDIYVVSGGETLGGKPSTVVDFTKEIHPSWFEKV